MSDCIDTSILVAAMVSTEPFHDECLALIYGGGCGLYLHGVVETFNILTGGREAFRMPASKAAEFFDDHYIPRLSIVPLTAVETLRAMREAEPRGVRGGAIFDYLHLVAARKARGRRLFTLNISDFRAFHRAGDPEIVHP